MNKIFFFIRSNIWKITIVLFVFLFSFTICNFSKKCEKYVKKHASSYEEVLNKYEKGGLL